MTYTNNILLDRFFQRVNFNIQRFYKYIYGIFENFFEMLIIYKWETDVYQSQIISEYLIIC